MRLFLFSVNSSSSSSSSFHFFHSFYAVHAFLLFIQFQFLVRIRRHCQRHRRRRRSVISVQKKRAAYFSCVCFVCSLRHFSTVEHTVYTQINYIFCSVLRFGFIVLSRCRDQMQKHESCDISPSEKSFIISFRFDRIKISRTKN